MTKDNDYYGTSTHWLWNLASSFLDRTNGIVTSLTACFLLYTRSIGVAYFGVGVVSCSVAVKMVKRGIRQPRPPSHLQRKRKTSYGMPSTHSAAIAFYMTYILLACRRLPIHPTLPQSEVITRVIVPLVILPWGTAIVGSRVWLGYHTWPQVAVGLSFGMIVALVWFHLWVSGVNEWGWEAEHALIGYLT